METLRPGCETEFHQADVASPFGEAGITQINLRFGMKLQQLRLRRSLSLEEFARLCSLPASRIRAIETTGEEVTLEQFHAIANGLGVSMSQFARNI